MRKPLWVLLNLALLFSAANSWAQNPPFVVVDTITTSPVNYPFFTSAIPYGDGYAVGVQIDPYTPSEYDGALLVYDPNAEEYTELLWEVDASDAIYPYYFDFFTGSGTIYGTREIRVDYYDELMGTRQRHDILAVDLMQRDSVTSTTYT